MIFAVKAFMGERGLRAQYKAKRAIDEAKGRIEDILDAWRVGFKGFGGCSAWVFCLKGPFFFVWFI